MLHKPRSWCCRETHNWPGLGRLLIFYFEANRQVTVSDRERWPFRSPATAKHMCKENLISPLPLWCTGCFIPLCWQLNFSRVRVCMNYQRQFTTPGANELHSKSSSRSHHPCKSKEVLQRKSPFRTARPQWASFLCSTIPKLQTKKSFTSVSRGYQQSCKDINLPKRSSPPPPLTIRDRKMNHSVRGKNPHGNVLKQLRLVTPLH